MIGRHEVCHTEEKPEQGMEKGDEKVRRHRRTYLDLFRPLLACAAAAAVFLSAQILRDQLKMREICRITVTMPSGTIPAEILPQIDALPGLRGRWAMYGADVQLQIGSYSAAAEVWGVELSAYPLTIMESAGEKRNGTSPLLIAGEHFFEGLSDEYGYSISERQAGKLKSQIASLTAKLKLPDAGSPGTAAYSGAGADAVGTDEMTRQDIRSYDAEFLGITEEDGLYMDAAQMERWLTQIGIPCEIRRVELAIRGTENARTACDALLKAGFLCERRA